MRNKKAFTLVELIAILAIIAIIAAIAFPNILNLIKQTELNKYNTFAKVVEQACEIYVEEHRENYPSLNQTGGIAIVPVLDLINADLIKSTATDPESNELASLYNVIVSVNSDNTKSYKYNGSKTTTSGYVQTGLVLHYDAIENGGSGIHSNTTTTWTDISGNNNNGTISTPRWDGNYLNLDGIEVTTSLDAATNFPPTSDYTISLLYKVNSAPTINTTYGDTGMLIGAASYSGMGLGWRRNTTQSTITMLGYGRASAGTDWREYEIGVTPPTKIYAVDYVYSATDSKSYTYVNGVLKLEGITVTGTYYTIGNIGINKNQTVGGNHGTARLNMDVYSAKIYNQALTSEEVKQNYAIDKKRFDL